MSTLIRPAAVPGRRFVTRLLGLFAGVILLLGAQTAAAQDRSFSVIRDTEIEETLGLYARPILEAAGLNPDGVNIVIVNRNELNAFVSGGQNIFLFTGLILEAETPGELIGVIAHEAGHISGGHLIRVQDAIERAQVQALVSALAGLIIGGVSGEAGAGGGLVLGGQEAARRGLLAYSRVQESAADQAAVTYLTSAGQSPRGLLSFFEKLADQELLPPSLQNEYVRTHPLTSDRIEAMRHAVATSRFRDRDYADAVTERHRRMHAKLFGFLNPAQARRRYRSDAPDIASRYGRAIADYRSGEIEDALVQIDRLIAAEPSNPYFHELRGQMILEYSGSRRFTVADAVTSYRRAIDLRPDSPLIRAAYANALIQIGGREALEEAVENLTLVLRDNEGGIGVHRMLARGYADLGNRGMALLHSAEISRLNGENTIAIRQVSQAVDLLPAGTPGYIQASDLLAILEREEPEARRRRR